MHYTAGVVRHAIVVVGSRCFLRKLVEPVRLDVRCVYGDVLIAIVSGHRVEEPECMADFVGSDAHRLTASAQ